MSSSPQANRKKKKKGQAKQKLSLAQFQSLSGGVLPPVDPSDPPSNVLWIGNIGPSVTEDMLQEEFGAFGPLLSVRILRDKYCAFVNFEQIEDAMVAKHEMSSQVIGDQSVVIHFRQVTPQPAPIPASSLALPPGSPSLPAPSSPPLPSSLPVLPPAPTLLPASLSNPNPSPSPYPSSTPNALPSLPVPSNPNPNANTSPSPPLSPSPLTSPLADALRTNPPSRSLWIGNLTPSVTKAQLTKHFEVYGAIESVKILAEKSCAFVNFVSEESAVSAYQGAGERPLLGVPLQVNFGRLRSPDVPRRHGYQGRMQGYNGNIHSAGNNAIHSNNLMLNSNSASSSGYSGMNSSSGGGSMSNGGALRGGRPAPWAWGRGRGAGAADEDMSAAGAPAANHHMGGMDAQMQYHQHAYVQHSLHFHGYGSHVDMDGSYSSGNNSVDSDGLGVMMSGLGMDDRMGGGGVDYGLGEDEEESPRLPMMMHRQGAEDSVNPDDYFNELVSGAVPFEEVLRLGIFGLQK